MDILFEFLAEIVLEGSYHVASERKSYKWLRIPAMIVLVLFALLLVIIIIGVGMLSIKMLILKNMAGTFFCSILFFVMIYGSIRQVKKFLATYNKKKDEMDI